VERVFASGVSTMAVVQAPSALLTIATTFAAFIEERCAAASSDEHQRSIEMLRRFATITNSEEVVFCAP
jgi:hypothetical protein